MGHEEGPPEFRNQSEEAGVVEFGVSVEAVAWRTGGGGVGGVDKVGDPPFLPHGLQYRKPVPPQKGDAVGLPPDGADPLRKGSGIPAGEEAPPRFSQAHPS